MTSAANSDADRSRLRATFDAAAERYDRVRPRYNEALFAQLQQHCGLEPGSRVLEIGCGTGQASIALARMGCQLLGVELGDHLADVARANLRPFPGCTVVTAAFEDHAVPPESFDLVLAATSWHWLHPGVRAAKAASALRPGGWLATITTHHVEGGDTEFFAQAQECYERWDPATPAGLRLAPARDIPDSKDDIDESPAFAPPSYHRFEQDIEYDTDGYLEVLLTYSGHLDLPAADREGLLHCIRELIDRDFGGRITKRYLWELKIAQRI